MINNGMLILLFILITIASLMIFFRIKNNKEKMCLCNGPQISRFCSDKTKTQLKYNRGNTELAWQNPSGPLVMPYDVFPGQPNPSDKNRCEFTPL